MAKRTEVICYIEENEFKNDKGEDVKYLSLILPVTDKSEKRIKAEQFALSLALENANK